MGSYATTTSLSELIPNFLSGNTTTSDTGGTAQFSRHIDRAESIVNSYITARYSLPFTTVPPVVRTLSEDIACYFAVRSAYTQDGQNLNQYYPEYKEALKSLESIRSGDIKLSLTDGSLIPTLSTNRFLSSTKEYAPIINLDDPENWRVDPNQLEDIADGRE